MNLSKEQKESIQNEFDYVIQRMNESETIEQALYYFSGIHSNLSRIFNINYSTELLFTYGVLSQAYDACMGRLGALKRGESVISFNELFLSKLIELTKKLSEDFFNKPKRNTVLENIATLGYTTTGNGYYLAQKGMIDIFSTNQPPENN